MSYVKVKGTVVAATPRGKTTSDLMVRLDAVPLIVCTPGPDLKVGDAVEVELSNLINVSAWSVKPVGR